MLDLEEQLRRYGDALGAHQMDSVAPVDLEHQPNRSRRFLGLVAVGAIALLVAVGIGTLAISSHRNRIRTTNRPATTAAPAPRDGLNRPESLALAVDGSLLVANQGTDQVLRRLSNTKLTVVAGTGVPGFDGDGHAAVDARLAEPHGIAVGKDGTIYIADTGNARLAVRRRRCRRPTHRRRRKAHDGDRSRHRHFGRALVVAPRGRPCDQPGRKPVRL
jgi:glucose/arabinose dehydrogenase